MMKSLRAASFHILAIGVIVLGAALLFWQRRSRSRSRVSSTPSLIVSPAPSEAFLTELAAAVPPATPRVGSGLLTAPTETPRSAVVTATTEAAIQRIPPRASMTIWFLLTAVPPILAAQALHVKEHPELSSVANILYLISGLLIVGLIIVLGATRRRANLVWPRWTWRFTGLVALSAVALLAVNGQVFAADNSGEDSGSAIAWLLAAGGAIAIAWQPGEKRTPEEPPATRWEVFALIGLTALAFALRAVALDRIPAMILGDETKYAVAGRYLVDNGIVKPLITGTDGHWNLWLSMIGIFLRMFGQSVAAMRLPSAVAGTLLIPTTYAVARLLWGRRTALIVAALLVTFPHQLHYSRVGFNSVFDPLFTMLVFGWLWLAWRTGRRSAWLLTAFSAGLAQYFFVGGRLVLIEAAVLGLYWLITSPRQVRMQALNIALALGAFICIVMPNIYFAMVHPDEYFSSINVKNIYRSGWMQSEMQTTGLTEADLLWQQFQGVYGSFVRESDEAFYWQQTILTPMMAVLAGLALIYFVLHIRAGPYFWVLTSLALLILFGGVLVVSPSAGSHRLLGSGPFIYLAIAVLIDRALVQADRIIRRPRLVAVIGTIIVVALAAADARYYFVDYLTNHELDSPEVNLNLVNRYLIDVQARLDQRPLQIVCVGFNADYCRGTTLHLLAPELFTHAEIIDSDPASVDITPLDNQMQVLIVNAALADRVEAARQRHPGIEPETHYDPRGNPVFVSYELLPPAP